MVSRLSSNSPSSSACFLCVFFFLLKRKTKNIEKTPRKTKKMTSHREKNGRDRKGDRRGKFHAGKRNLMGLLKGFRRGLLKGFRRGLSKGLPMNLGKKERSMKGGRNEKKPHNPRKREDTCCTQSSCSSSSLVAEGFPPRSP